MSNYAAAATDLGGAVSSIFGAIGGAAEASAYGKASQIAEQEKGLALEAGAVTEAQQQRTAYKVISSGQATQAANGLAASGSGQDILRDSASQAAIQRQTTGVQTQITAQGYEQQSEALKGQEQAASASSKGGLLSGALGIAGAIASLF